MRKKLNIEKHTTVKENKVKEKREKKEGRSSISETTNPVLKKAKKYSFNFVL